MILPLIANSLNLGDSFKAFDYGPEENVRLYGTVEPINYDLSRVTAPVYIFWSPKDTYASPQVL